LVVEPLLDTLGIGIILEGLDRAHYLSGGVPDGRGGEAEIMASGTAQMEPTLGLEGAFDEG
jgi:hypothetical protein